jgi:stage V sporulation protein R
MIDKEVKELEEAIDQIWEIATKKFGLDPFPVHFEIVPATVMYEIGSYALPGRYSHWTFGKAYHRMKTLYDFGLSKIYEVVINSNPAYAFLLETNSPIQNKMIVAHVLGHVDFFKNNIYFSRTNRRMIDEASMHARRMAEYEFKYGRKVVEEFLDAVLSIEEHIDPDFFIKKDRQDKEAKKQEAAEHKHRPGRFDDLFTKEELGLSQAKPDEEANHKPSLQVPEKDVVYFIMKNSPVLEDWQRDIMAMLHEEMEYFIPQMQTKVMNEGWACATGDSLLLTEKGFIRFEQLYEMGEKIQVAAGKPGQLNQITDFHKEEQAPTIRIRTSRGYTIEGALKHRILLADGTWAYLKNLKHGDRIIIGCGTNIWPKEKLPLSHIPPSASATLAQVAALAGAVRHSSRSRHKANSTNSALKATAYQAAPFNQAPIVSEDIAWLLGYFTGDGNTTDPEIKEYAAKLSEAIREHLDVGSCHRIVVPARERCSLLQSLGVNPSEKAIPTAILRSPKQVVSAFLRGYFDADAYVGPEGIGLASASEELIRDVQIVLLNYGILSTQRSLQDGRTQLEIANASAARFLEEIGFSFAGKQQALSDYAKHHNKVEDATDAIVSIEYGCADVFDITVDTSHAYVANGFVNHNSFWHARIMRELDLSTAEYLEFAELHAGVVCPQKGQINPYYLGYKMFENIEKRWDNPTKEERERYGRRGGEGREKIFEVRELDNDISFLRNYLTEELCEELDLFVYELVDDEEWTVTEKKWEKVRDQLVANMTNFGFPYIEVVDGDYDGNRELYLRHRYEGVELDMKYARKTLEYVQKLWGRPVHLETVVDGDTLVMHYDGKQYDED